MLWLGLVKRFEEKVCVLERTERRLSLAVGGVAGLDYDPVIGSDGVLCTTPCDPTWLQGTQLPPGNCI